MLHASCFKTHLLSYVVMTLVYSFWYCTCACPYIWTNKTIHLERTTKPHSKLHSEGFWHNHQEEVTVPLFSDGLYPCSAFLMSFAVSPKSLFAILSYSSFPSKAHTLGHWWSAELSIPEFTCWSSDWDHTKSSEKAKVNLIGNGFSMQNTAKWHSFIKEPAEIRFHWHKQISKGWTISHQACNIFLNREIFEDEFLMQILGDTVYLPKVWKPHKCEKLN